MSGEKVKESGADALEAASIAVYDKDEFEGLPDEEIVKLCSDYAAYTRISLAEEHGQIVTNIAAIEEQLHTFTELVEMIGSDNTAVLTRTLPAISAHFEALKPSFQQIDRMEGLVNRAGQDMDVMEKQLEEAENTVEEGTLKNVLKMPLNLFNKQIAEGSGTSAARDEFVPHEIFSTNQYFETANK
eukprot:TRINITY_DN16617_c0_g1_i1.p1 TRINITY_DN16617_c0_g1~~TRINITY_DN16617_c0_g1_i1.p1  ORF type:complete len:186 (-),score=83.61 TRINITY_DN16617_c0_g1_i1:24-581(-)